MSQSVLITGASSGIGRQLAIEFAARGYRLALTARRLDALAALRDELQARHPGRAVEIAALDVQRTAEVAPAVEALATALGGLDIVVANAGIGDTGLVGTGGFARDAAVIQTNVLGAMATLDAAVALFRRQKRGQLVAVSSVAAARGMPGAGAYCASKAALAVYADSIRHELYGTGIAVTTLYPGFIDTPLNNHLAKRPFLVTVEDGARRMADLIERRAGNAAVPRWPWTAMMTLLRHMPSAQLALQRPMD